MKHIEQSPMSSSKAPSFFSDNSENKNIIKNSEGQEISFINNVDQSNFLTNLSFFEKFKSEKQDLSFVTEINDESDVLNKGFIEEKTFTFSNEKEKDNIGDFQRDFMKLLNDFEYYTKEDNYIKINNFLKRFGKKDKENDEPINKSSKLGGKRSAAHCERNENQYSPFLIKKKKISN